MLIHILLLLGGCVLLYAGATWLVRGAEELAVALKIPKAIVGLLLVAFGTSAPELIVNLIAAYQGQTSFALANVSGSNLTNLLVGFGLCGVLGGLIISWRTFIYDLWALILSATIPLVVLLLHGHMPLWAVIPLLVGIVAYIWTIRRRFKDRVPGEVERDHLHPFLSSLLFLFGAAVLYGGGHLVLTGAVAIAENLQIEASLIGLTLVAAGTSIPDAVASIVAARRGEHEIAVGNLLGSNIANILVVLSGTMLAAWTGADTTVADTTVLEAVEWTKWDYTAVLVASLGFFGAVARWGRIGRVGGMLMIACFCIYMGLRVYCSL